MNTFLKLYSFRLRLALLITDCDDQNDHIKSCDECLQTILQTQEDYESLSVIIDQVNLSDELKETAIEVNQSLCH